MFHRRALFETIWQHTKMPEHTIITGPRQVGKTFLLKQIQSELERAHQAVVFLTCEDPTILNRLNKHPENVFNYLTLKDDQKTYVIIDEVQYLKDPSKFLKLLFDKYSGRLKVLASGSSAFYLDQKFTDSLSGRKRIFQMYGCSFSEALQLSDQQTLLGELKRVQENPVYLSGVEIQLKKAFSEYLVFGGYPAVVTAADISEKKIQLKELRSSFLKRDILEAGVKNEAKFYELVILLAAQTGNLVNKTELANTLRMADATVENYLLVLQKTFHLHLLRPFVGNVRKELTKMPKAFFHDNGLRNSFLNDFRSIDSRQDKGELLENYLFTALRNTHDLDEINFWRTADGNEVDFIIQNDDSSKSAFECKWRFQKSGASKYKKFAINYPEISLKIVCFDFEEPENWILKI